MQASENYMAKEKDMERIIVFASFFLLTDNFTTHWGDALTKSG